MSQDQINQKIIICDLALCTGCRICENACAVSNEGQINPRLSRIRSVRIDPVFNVAVSCRKCDYPKCLDACARDAIFQDSKTKMIVINANKCDGCGLCVDACNFGVMSMGIDERLPIVCDLCTKNNDGKPVCVEYCATEALQLTSISEIEDEQVKKFHKIFQQNSDRAP